jgi:hypothetical protein
MKNTILIIPAIVGYLMLANCVLHTGATTPSERQAIVAMEVDDLPAYDSLAEAGVAAIARDYKCSHVYECGGVIAQRPDGKFVVGPVRSDAAGDSVSLHYIVPSGWKLVADQHTHPCLPDSHHVNYFSPADVSNNLSGAIPGFMGDLCTGKVHFYDPATMSPNDEKTEDGFHLTQGKIVGQITVDGKSQEPDVGL